MYPFTGLLLASLGKFSKSWDSGRMGLQDRNGGIRDAWMTKLPFYNIDAQSDGLNGLRKHGTNIYKMLSQKIQKWNINLKV